MKNIKATQHSTKTPGREQNKRKEKHKGHARKVPTSIGKPNCTPNKAWKASKDPELQIALLRNRRADENKIELCRSKERQPGDK